MSKKGRVTKLHDLDGELEEQESEIVVFSGCVEEENNEVLLELAEIYLQNGNVKEVISSINKVVSRLDKEFYALKSSSGQTSAENDHEFHVALQYKQCAVLLEKSSNSVQDAARCLYKGLVCSNNTVSYDHDEMCTLVWQRLIQELIDDFQPAFNTLSDLLEICHGNCLNRPRIILFMAFEVAGNLTKFMHLKEAEEQSKQQVYSILLRNWLICGKCHFMLKEYEKSLEVFRFLCKDPRQCNCEVLELFALSLMHTQKFVEAENVVEHAIKVSTSEVQSSRLKELQNRLKLRNPQNEAVSKPVIQDGESRKNTDLGYSYGEMINLVESVNIDPAVPLEDQNGDWSDTQSIAESEYSLMSDVNNIDDSSSVSGFSQRSRKRKVRRKTKNVRHKKGIDSDRLSYVDGSSSGTSTLPSKQSTKEELIEKWRQESNRAWRYKKSQHSTHQHGNEEILYSREDTENDNISDTSSVTSRMTFSQRELSADDFSDSDYDLSDSGDDWYGSETDEDPTDDCTVKHYQEESSYFARSQQYHQNEFVPRNILEREYFQKGLDLSEECIDKVGSHYFKGKRIIYTEFKKQSFDEQCIKLPKMYKKCTIGIESAHRAICTVIEPTDEILEIEILGRSKCGQTFSDDTVVVRIFKSRSQEQNGGKVHGEVVSLIERHRYKHIDHPVFVCLLDLREGHLMKPLCRTVPKLHILHSKVLKNFKHLQKSRVEVYRYDAVNGTLDFLRYHDVEGERDQWLFIVALIKWKPNKIYPLAAVIDVIKCSQNPYDGIRILSKEYQVPYFYAKSTVDGVESVFKEASSFKVTGYTGLSDKLRVFTIDPIGSKDLDDALSVEVQTDGTCVVGVHITDVTSFIKQGDPVDLEAQERCVTFYPGKGFRPFAMLPEPLSEDLLSLLPNRQRPVISIFFKFNKYGELSALRPDVKKSIVKSCRQFTYQEVQDILDNKLTDLSEDLFEDIKLLFQLSQKLKIDRLGNAAFSYPVEIDVSEDENPMETYQAHSLVEEFMILANHNIAKILIKQFPECVPVLCQQAPPEEVVTNWYNLHMHYIHHIMGLQNINILNGKEISVSNSPSEGRTRKLTPVQTWVLEEIKSLVSGMDNDKNESRIKQLIQSDYLYPKQALAYHEWNMLQESSKYICSKEIINNPKRGLHYSLGRNPYVHFTSPIRRYCDIIIHRLISAYINKLHCPYSADEVYKLCTTMNDATRRANQFKKDCKQFILGRYLKRNPVLFYGFVKEMSDSGVRIIIPGLQKLPSARKEVKFSLLDVGCKPELKPDVDMQNVTKYEADRKMVLVKWEKRLYSFMHKTCKKPKSTRFKEEINFFSKYLRIYPHQNTTFLRYKDQWTKILDYTLHDTSDELKKILSTFKDIPLNQTFLSTIKDLSKNLTYLNLYNDKQTISSHKRSVMDVSSEVRQGIIVEHKCKFQVPFHHGQIVKVQMSACVSRGFFTPVPQILDVTDNVKFCIDHYDNPVKTLLRYAKQKSKTRYSSVEDYIKTWIPIVEMESAVNAVHGEESAVINDIPVKFHGRRGRFVLTKGFCDIRDLDLGSGDIRKIRQNIVEQNDTTEEDDLLDIRQEAKVSSAEDTPLETSEIVTKEDNNSSIKQKPTYTDVLSSHFLCIKLKHPLPQSVKSKIGRCLPKDSHYIWVGHGELIKSRTIKTKKYSERRGCEKKVLELDMVFKLHENSPSPPVQEVRAEDQCSVEVILKSKVFRRIECYIKLLGQASELAIDIALGNQIADCGADHLRLCRSMSYEVDVPDFPQNNLKQQTAIKKALSSRFSLIQGPPGTGKTFTGVKLVYLFDKLNNLCKEQDGKRRRIIFCGPSNKSVDLVARWVINKLGDKAPKIVRMYASAYEYQDFPVPGRATISTRSMRDAKPDRELIDKGLVLHHIIRQEGKPHAQALQELDAKFQVDNEIIKENEKIPHELRKPVNTKLMDIYVYKRLLYEATVEELDNYDVIFCTTSLAANPRLLTATKNQVAQVIIDECGMCSEPESMVPIIASHANQVVLIGDHKQLRPIIKCREASDLGLEKSLFERYSTNRGLITMLQEQYRMHSSICDFPSRQFYGDKLKTAQGVGTSHQPLSMWPKTDDQGHIPVVFCHIEGEEETLTVTTKEGNEQSKSNISELEQVMKVFKHMITVEGVDPLSINIMSQYNAQCTAIRNELTKQGYQKFNVTTVVSSQGGEWNYVIFSLVRSLPKYLIEKNPTEGWCIQNLGFITDRHQINVALTRAKRGLVIIGNKNVLECDEVWKKLLEDYKEKNCLFDARTFPSKNPSYAQS